ncbi:MAG: hypothetical protein WBW84_20040 [Acidobacteriaceae bacterium]
MGIEDQTRAEAIRTRMMVGNATCSMAEMQIRNGDYTAATENLISLEAAIDNVVALLRTDVISSSSVADLALLLEQLRERVRTLSVLLQSRR